MPNIYASASPMHLKAFPEIKIGNLNLIGSDKDNTRSYFPISRNKKQSLFWEIARGHFPISRFPFPPYGGKIWDFGKRDNRDELPRTAEIWKRATRTKTPLYALRILADKCITPRPRRAATPLKSTDLGHCRGPRGLPRYCQPTTPNRPSGEAPLIL